MAQSQLLQIKLSRFDAQPWGFRLQGGVDFASPLVVQKVNGGSLAEQAGLLPGDAVLKINDVDVFNLRHKDAQDIVVRSGNNFVITVQRGGSTWRPHVTPIGGQLPQPNQSSSYLQTVTKTSLAHKQQQDVQHIGCGYNNSARPFVNGGDGSVKSIVNKQYNTPVGIYSDESIAETLSAQAEVLAGGVLGVNFKKNEKEYQAEKSEVLKFLREEETGQSTPDPHSPANFYWTQSHAIGGNEPRAPQTQHQHPHQHRAPDERVGMPLQQNTLAPAAPHRPSLPQTTMRPSAAPKAPTTFIAAAKPAAPAAAAAETSDPRTIIRPVCPALQGPEYKAEMEILAATAAHDDGTRPLSVSGHPPCQLCGVGIVGVFVRIKDKNLHVECFKCATCGTSLKNQGYYNFNNKLYCDIHAKLAAMQNPPPGTEGYVPVPIKPNTKLSATTISAALNTHGYNGVSNGNSTPAPAPAPAPAPVAKPLATTTIENSNINYNNSGINNNNYNIISNSNNNIHNDTDYTRVSTMMANEQPIYGQLNMDTTNANTVQSTGEQAPFEYVTLTGNVIRSVLPPGKGVNINYKVNQGYARPYGASGAPPAAAPKSPISFPPPTQQQQWGGSVQQAPKPASNPYATLPRTNVGAQGRHIQTHYNNNYNNYNRNYTIQYRKPNAGPNKYATIPAYNSSYDNYNNYYNQGMPSSFMPTQASAAAPPAVAAAPASTSVPTATPNVSANSNVSGTSGAGGRGGTFSATSAPKRGRGIFNKAVGPGVRVPLCNSCNIHIRGPFITALGRIWCPEHFICVNANCRRPLQDIGFVEEKGDLYCEYCFEKYLAPSCSKCGGKIKGDCLNAIGKHFHPECFTCAQCGKLFGNTPFFLEDGNAYCEADWNELFTTKCFACGFPVEAGDRWVEALNHNYHSQCFNCTYCKQNLEGQSFYNKGGRPFCKNHAR